MGELFEHTTVKTVMDKIGEDFSLLSDAIKETNELITTALGSPDKSVYGDAGNKILATWDENCSTLNSFMSIYDSWSTMAVSIAKEFAEFDKGVAVVGDKDAANIRTIANYNKSNWLKTYDASKAYVGSSNTYTDFESNSERKEHSNLKDKRVVEYTNEKNEKITMYYNLDGKWIAIKNNGQLTDANGKKITEEELNGTLQRNQEVGAAQAALKSVVATKHVELAKRDKERTEVAKYKNPQNLSASKAEFIQTVAALAIKAYKKYGVLPSLTIGQAVFESYYGESEKARNLHNFFGIKTGTNWDGPSEAGWRKYSSLAESVEDHSKLLTKSRYRPALEATNYYDASIRVAECGYCPTSTYGPNLARIIKENGLDQWDPKV